LELTQGKLPKSQALRIFGEYQPSGLGMEISRPSDSPGWSLEQNPDLTTANWGPSGCNGFNISDNGINKSLSMPSSSGNLFFRLLHP
jgi:hypothetical protein